MPQQTLVDRPPFPRCSKNRGHLIQPLTLASFIQQPCVSNAPFHFLLLSNIPQLWVVWLFALHPVRVVISPVLIWSGDELSGYVSSCAGAGVSVS
jgi:hypothetical protein